jgi:hypothetical protein
MERREAQRPASLAARTPKAAVPGNGDTAVSAMADREVRPAGHVTCRIGAAIRPGASRRSIPSSGTKEKGKTAPVRL